MIVRPQPKAFETENIAEGRYRADTGVSASWFSKGGLEWDGQQLKLWDADGEAQTRTTTTTGRSQEPLTRQAIAARWRLPARSMVCVRM